jgi:hypothetical protein
MVNYNNEKNVEDDSTEKCLGTLVEQLYHDKLHVL